ncbi:unnamed protein product [Protopolystoma xenopodis]|uniref:Uncharacterized protein n=1 Tax=Protopolystoma xenopodis TaxID=117903 RepID=A0A448XFW2_9PLAT|nr:unnamed protein product [Protopolystoma xenopodis]
MCLYEVLRFNELFIGRDSLFPLHEESTELNNVIENVLQDVIHLAALWDFACTEDKHNKILAGRRDYRDTKMCMRLAGAAL